MPFLTWVDFWSHLFGLAKQDGTKIPVWQKWHGINSPWDQLSGSLFLHMTVHFNIFLFDFEISLLFAYHIT